MQFVVIHENLLSHESCYLLSWPFSAHIHAMFVRTGINSRSSDRTRRDEYGLPSPPSFPRRPLPRASVRNDETSAVAAIQNFYGAVTVLAMIPTYGAWKREEGRKDKERRFVRPSNPRAHVELEEFHPSSPAPPRTVGGGEGAKEGGMVPKCVGRSHTYRGAVWGACIWKLLRHPRGVYVPCKSR